MRAFSFCLVMLVSAAAGIVAPQFAQAQTPEAAPVLRSETQLVLVDVTVRDRDGHPVHGLKREDFTIAEDKQAQTIRSFEEHTSTTHLQAGPALPPMPPGTFTNYTPVPPHGALNVLLLDMLNTPPGDQNYVREQLRQYVDKAAPGVRIAIFGLSERLFLLQGFSADPEVLKNAVDHKAQPRKSSLLPGVDGTDGMESLAEAMEDSGIGGQAMQTLANLRQFEAEEKSMGTQMRIKYTLAAFNMLAHYLSAFPGRKNLVWFSGSFPIVIRPDPAITYSFNVVRNEGDAFRETEDLLSRAQVAVYPVDARGLMIDPAVTVVSDGRNMGRIGGAPGKSSADFFQSQAEEHGTMSLLAEQTGGAVFYNTNNLATAVEKAIESGANYYTLAYSPADRDKKESYRAITVKLNGGLQSAGYTLGYRRGYTPAMRKENDVGGGTSAHDGEVYARAAMAHGAPEPQEILFKVRVQPVGAPEQALAAGNAMDPAHPIKPPFRRFAVDIAAVGSNIQLKLEKDGRRAGMIAFQVLLYDSDGQLRNGTGKTVPLNLTPEQYQRLLAGVHAHFEISAPEQGPGRIAGDFLRIGIQDVATNHFGAVEIPLVTVARLTPASPASLPH